MKEIETVSNRTGSKLPEKFVYFFSADHTEGNASMKNTLGGKGANLAEMTGMGLPVPPGFTISTEMCQAFYDNGEKLPDALKSKVLEALGKVEKLLGKKFGDTANPLLVSVRSGARASMPGMMDTILNLGLNDQTVDGLAKQSNNPRFAWDSYRRFLTMYSNVVMDMNTSLLEVVMEDLKESKHYKLDTEMTTEDLKFLVANYKKQILANTGKNFPTDPLEQLWGAISAVFKSWNSPRAITYRGMHGYPSHWGTAVNVQSMVFGNMGDDCATGVAFTRNPSTGERVFFGEFLINAQGEDVVAGIRTPNPLSKHSATGSGTKSLEELMPKAYGELVEVYKKLEKHYRDMQDIEFTIERNKLWMLQTRNGKRTAKAALRIACEMIDEKLISEDEALLRIAPSSLDQLLHPTLDTKAEKTQLAKGLPASPGGATGQIVFSSEDAVAWAEKGLKTILVRIETSPEDIEGMVKAQGVLTTRGGMTCIAGETKILTDRGFLTAESAFETLEAGGSLRILSVDSATLQPVWREIIAAGRKPSEVITVAVSQTGNGENNHLRLTPDHKMYTFEKRKLRKKPLEEILSHDDFIHVVSNIPALSETKVNPALAYVAGAIFSDGYISLKPTKGSVTFIQKPTPEKADFIAAVERSFQEAFGVSFTYVRERTSSSELRGRLIVGSVEDRICYKRDPAARLMEIYQSVDAWVLSLDRVALLHFLAGYVDGDGTYSEGSSAVRLQISISQKEEKLIQALMLACLRLGIVPQLVSNRENFTIQIAEEIDSILAFSQRIEAEVRPRMMESRCLALKGLFDDIIDNVNFMGRVREGLKRNLMFGAEKVRRDILPLCTAEAYSELQMILNSSLRSYRIREVQNKEAALVYNFEVDATDDLDKNFVVFSSRLTPILVSNSHAAVVARGMGKCCVAGCGDMDVDYRKKELRVKGYVLKEGDKITLDGGTGEVFLGEVKTVEPSLDDYFQRIMKLADTKRKLGVRTNADTPHDAQVARKFGAEGIGLCRTEHMFFGADRIDVMRQMIIAETREERIEALDRLLPMQRTDFIGLFDAMKGLPVTIRLLDPPLHEFLPHSDEEAVELAARMGINIDKLRLKVRNLHEFNPMLGHRGCRLAITYPEIYQMQARAIAEAACEVIGRGHKLTPEIMVPLVNTDLELKRLAAQIEEEVLKVQAKAGVKFDFMVGTMIELPRAALTADKIAEHAKFFSFGTNDLTQTTLGISRDDAGRFLATYVSEGLFDADPFASIDQKGVGKLVEMAVELGLKTRPDIKLGVCGEHGGDPASIQFFHRVGLNYVSCSPYRVPIARLAAAQAAISR